MEKATDKGKTFAALLTDLLKAFHCLAYYRIIVKVNASKFSLYLPRLMHSYLSNRKQ